jgi:hypothetical protein
MSARWNAIGNRFWNAVTTFAAAGRLVDADDSGAIVLVGNDERWLEPATLVTAAQMMQRNGIVPPATEDIPQEPHQYAHVLNLVEGIAEIAGYLQERTAYCVFYAHQLGTATTVEALAETHQEVARVLAHSLEEVFETCNTDPATLAGIAEKNPGHTSMSVGDVVFDGETYWACRPVGWEVLPHMGEVAAQGELITEAMIEENFNQAMRDLDNTAGGLEEETQPRRGNMTFHDCEVLGRKHLFASTDGTCRHCRPVEETVPVLTGDDVIEMPVNEAEEVYAPSFEVLLDDVGGEEAFAASVGQIAEAKRSGRRGDSIPGRKTRELLNLIMQAPAPVKNDLLASYKEFVDQFGIALRPDPDGVLFHDYAVFASRSTATGPNSGTGSAGTGWQANLAQKRAMRNAFTERVRVSRNIVMSWVSTDGGERGTALLGPNTDETRLLAAEYQAAARKKGFQARFSLV